MTTPPIRKATLAVTVSLLLFGKATSANNKIYDDLEISDNNRYYHEQLSFNDVVEPTTSPQRSINIPANTFALSPSLRAGLAHAARYLQSQNPNRTVAKRGLNIPNRTLSQTLNKLLNWGDAIHPQSLQQHFDLIPLSNKQSQNSKFTGYYTPIIRARSKPNAQFHYPIYRSPMSSRLRLLTRSQISSGALNNRGLEVAWTDDPVGLFYMQIQGSGVLEYDNGQRVPLQFDGSNERRFRSPSDFMQSRGLISGNLGRDRIQKWLYANPAYLEPVLNSNPRYVYFKPAYGHVVTASGMPITPGHSVAVDTDYIPFGSIILAEVPIINSRGQTLGAEWKILLPQDRGIAIKGPARMDIYTGKGEQARQIANQLTGYGRAFILLNRSNTQLTQYHATDLPYPTM
ncbi:MAG: hypothetical protein CSB47_04125 [Proteobacteria bacterium]|nr:MAG: hypothetical protein CSB47_04125 [Pseudomonadota bacterium]